MELKLYVVRKSYSNTESQISVYINNLEDAIKDCEPGYHVYNALTGAECYSNPIKEKKYNYAQMWNRLKNILKEKTKDHSFNGAAFYSNGFKDGCKFVLDKINEIESEVWPNE